MTQLGTKKSRKGCTNCKRRRVKCNEQAPCANCSRRGEQCSLLGAPSTGTGLGPESTGLSPEEWIQDLELMHHYDNDTLLQPLGIREDCQHLWRQHVPREALRNGFLMHGILALSALHIAHTRSHEADKYLRLCDKHQTKALEMFRSVLCTDITPEISTALFALSSTISILSMGRACADAMNMPEPRYVGMEQVAELFLLTRGVRDLIHTCMEWVSTGPLGPMLESHYMLEAHEVQLPVVVQKQFVNLQFMLEECCAAEYRPECQRALRRLEDVYRNVLRVSATGDVETGQIWRWMLLVPCEFVTMIRACFPPALILLAHFAAVSLTVRKAWYTTDWGNYVLTGISIALYGSDMYQYLEWPLEQAQSNMMILTHSEEIDSVMNGSPSAAMAGFPFDTTLSLEQEITEAELGFVAF